MCYRMSDKSESSNSQTEIKSSDSSLVPESPPTRDDDRMVLITQDQIDDMRWYNLVRHRRFVYSRCWNWI